MTTETQTDADAAQKDQLLPGPEVEVQLRDHCADAAGCGSEPTALFFTHLQQG